VANIYLGLAGAEVLLPPLNWSAGGERSAPVGFKKNLNKVSMLDGSTRYNIKAVSQKTFELEWDYLTAANVLTLIGLAELACPLHYQNNWVDAAWRWVVVTAIDYEALQSIFAATPLYHVILSLEELK